MCFAATVHAGDESAIPTNRTWDVVKSGKARMGPRDRMKLAGELLGDWSFHFAGLDLDGPGLIALSKKAPKEPFLRLVREEFKLPLDLSDFLLFLDDLLLAGKSGLRGKPVWVSFGRARLSGILLHPHDVFFKNRPRRYGEISDKLSIDKPTVLQEIPEPAKDGDPPGPAWYSRFQNPQGEENMLLALKERNPSLADRTESLLGQLREQDCVVDLHTTVRHRERGYLMWGAYLLSQMTTRKQVVRTVRLLDRSNRKWKLDVPIRWLHPDGWKATIESARQMKDTYGVGYASRRGALKSKHYDAEAIDLTAMGLPRKLTLKGADGKTRTFDLSAPHQPRDINLTPELVKWIEKHFCLKKVKSDYPHWNDAKKTK
jgi:hypothetical protein